jgi:hypothetical protein
MAKPAEPETPPNPLLALNGSVTEEHLADVEAKIVTAEAELGRLKRLRLLGLAMLGRAPLRKGGIRKPAGERTGGRPEPVDIDTKRRQVVQFLKDGPKNGREIITGCGVQPAKLHETMGHGWFNQTAQGYHITTQARREAL